MSQTIASTMVLRLGYKIQSDWSAHGTLFDGFRTSKTEYDTILSKASTARENSRAARERRTAELARAKAVYQEVVAKAKKEFALARQKFDEEVATATLLEKSALTELSRLANGARYHAKSIALSDTDAENDNVGKAL